MKRAFTLIELLVVIAIIGSLSALFLPNFMSARERARDSARKSDLKQLQKALELYRQDQTPPVFPTAASGGFGTSTTCNTPLGSSPVYMNKIPCNPLGPTPYYYSVDNSTLTYTLCACIENKADPDATSGNCDDTNYICATSNPKKYVVNQP